MKKSDNPLYVLGMSRKMLLGLPLSDVRTLVKHIGRGLQAIHHPDRGGKTDISAAINNALVAVEKSDDDTLRAYIHMATKLTQSQKERNVLLRERDEIDTLLLSAGKHLVEYLECAIGADPRPNVFQAQSLYVSNPTRRRMIDQSQTLLQSELDMFSEWIEIKKEKDGIRRKFLRRYKREGVRCKREEFSPNTFLVGFLDHGEVNKKLGGIVNLESILFGTYSLTDLHTTQLLSGKNKTQGRLPEKSFSIARFTSIVAPRITPFVPSVSGDYLFSLTQDKGRFFATFEGKFIANPPREGR